MCVFNLLVSSAVLFAFPTAFQPEESRLTKGSHLSVVLGGDVGTIVKDQLLQLIMTNKGEQDDHLVKTQGTVLEATNTSITFRALVWSRKTQGKSRMVNVTAMVDRSRIEKPNSLSKGNADSSDCLVRIDLLSEVEIETWNLVQSIKRQSLTSMGRREGIGRARDR